MKFAHLSDCHLGGWRQPELQEINFLSFQYAINKCIEEGVEFVLIAGDLFDSAYPPIDILKRAFAEFRKLKESSIPCYLIAGSHDYSVSGKTFLDVLERGGFCEICKFTETEDCITLHPTFHKTVEIYGYPGKTSGLEVADLRKVKIAEEESRSGNFRILMLHTTLTEAIPADFGESISIQDVPKADYYALGHLHIDFTLERDRAPVVYGGPTYPNNFQELEDMGYGRFYIVEAAGYTKVEQREIRIKPVAAFNLEIDNALTATELILREFEQSDLQDKIVLLRLRGTLQQGTNADIDYKRLKDYLDSKKAFCFLKNTVKLVSEEKETDIKISTSEMSKMEDELIKEFEEKNPDKFNKLITELLHALETQKQEDEKSAIYEARLLSELNKVLRLELKT